MADGNFNRSPLSTNSYQSGVRAGKAAMRTIALQALETTLNNHCSTFSAEQRATIINTFKEEINK
ncbi:MAG: hypothetical protein II200_03055 [Bacteroidaceae bacterium]|nr:hypothetical protein [Bacteroidaceae bacterium]